jgi:hypothetical protein
LKGLYEIGMQTGATWLTSEPDRRPPDFLAKMTVRQADARAGDHAGYPSRSANEAPPAGSASSERTKFGLFWAFTVEDLLSSSEEEGGGWMFGTGARLSLPITYAGC